MVRLTLHVLILIVAIGWLTAVFGPWGTATPPHELRNQPLRRRWHV